MILMMLVEFEVAGGLIGRGGLKSEAVTDALWDSHFDFYSP